MSEKASIVLRGGHVQTMVAPDDIASAVAVCGNRIAYVGDDAGAEAYIGEGTKVIDLDGRFACPGFMDGHLHVPGKWITTLYQIDLEGKSTNEEYVETIRSFIEAHPDEEVYTGQPFLLNAYMLEDGSNPGPHKRDLDAICDTKPILLYDLSVHSVWVNSFVLDALGITRDTPDPEGGLIQRDKDGEPTGYLVDNAMWMANHMFPGLQISDEIWETTMAAFQDEANSMGVTAVVDLVDPAWLADSPYQVSHYHRWEDEGRLHLRVRPAFTAQPGDKAEDVIGIVKEATAATSNLVRPGMVKIYGDGVTESATAVMLEPYLEAAGQGEGWFGGDPIWDRKEFEDMVDALDAEGIQVHVHAIGDGMVRRTIDAYEHALNTNGMRDARHTITHVCAISHDDIPRLARLGIPCALQFLWMYRDDLCELEEAFIGTERAGRMYPVKDMVDAGVLVSGASDTPVTPYDPILEIQVGVTRNSPYPGERDTDMYRWPEQGLTAYQMLEIYTKNVAYQNFWEDELGTVEVGRLADLVVLDRNILEVDPSLISDARVDYTMSDGRIVYCREG